MWLFAWFVARRELSDTRLIGWPHNIAPETPGLWRFMVAANADATFSDLAPKIVPLAIGSFLGPVAAGLFSIAQRATVVLAQPAQFLGQAAYSEFARLIAAGNHNRALRNALLRCVGLALASAIPIVLILAFFSRDIAVLLGGQAFGDAAPVMIWLAISRLLLLIGPPFSAALIAIGRPGLSVAANVGSNLLTLPVLPPLMAWFGLSGAGIQAVLQAVASAVLLCVLAQNASKSAPIAAGGGGPLVDRN
jgi:O-antigen/teichoic acid export membrane protein